VGAEDVTQDPGERDQAGADRFAAMLPFMSPMLENPDNQDDRRGHEQH
jgi:hypothetical protein